jgi:hypothetical protein
MTQMDHNEAVRLHAAEKYLLGELPKEQHAEYEEHYFDCSACAEEIKATAAFMESARQVVRERQEVAEVVGERTFVPAEPPTGGWFGWLRPAFAVPVFAVMVLFIGYQNGVTIPSLKHSASSQTGRIISSNSSFQLLGSVRGGNESGENTNRVAVKRGESFLLKFDFTPTGTFSEYVWQLRDQAGRAVQQGLIGGDKKYQTVLLPVIGGVESAGKYNLVFFGDADGSGQSANRSEAQRITFTVEFLQ